MLKSNKGVSAQEGVATTSSSTSITTTPDTFNRRLPSSMAGAVCWQGASVSGVKDPSCSPTGPVSVHQWGGQRPL
ncbi:hypothetical protein AAFF_G00077480 [Aldrovandia affinis]|uniref:Uncharacterized protein n=1 Tax=Aldrovandia affinis TaxID=143900 RepID=A0AAD7RXU9_9TELE|nr:hypothetical protein AAFF_G00077480 [Aldrovandia affinis]